nr:MAG TPA: Repressor protein CI [Caudoviricetes sp.]
MLENRLKIARNNKKISQKELAKQLFISQQAYAKYETGNATPNPETLKKIANILDVSVDYLLGNSDIKNQALGIEKDPNYNGMYDTLKLKKIPLLGYISAGLPMYADEHLEGYIYTDLNGNSDYFALRVKGDSMNAARICDGDIVIVKVQNYVENGEIAVVMVNDENATVKRFYANKNIVTLSPQSYNPVHQIQQYDLRNTNIKILGKVVKIEIKL